MMSMPKRPFQPDLAILSPIFKAMIPISPRIFLYLGSWGRAKSLPMVEKGRSVKGARPVI